MAKTARQKITKKLDDIVSEIVRERNKRCVMCGSVTKLGNGHVFSRRSNSLRWDIRPDGNCHTQCWKHNYLHSIRDPYAYYQWYIEKFGKKRFDELYSEWHTIRKFSMPDLEEMYEELVKFKKALTDRNKIKSGRIVQQPTPKEVRISKEEEIDYSLEGRLKKHVVSEKEM